LTERNVSVVIPNWNGKELLEKNLPPLIEALQYEKGNHEIIIVDDASTDGSVEFIKDFYSQVRLIQVEKNRGFANACNIGVSKSKNDIVLLLNSDVEVKKDFLKPLLTHFDDKKVFATSPKVLTEDKKTFAGGKIGAGFKLGIFWVHRDIDKGQIKNVSSSLFATAGSSAFAKKKFMKLRGFDELYRPFYWEDIDICYRAWKRGWKILYEPKSIVYHKHQSTIGKVLKQSKIDCIHRKNKFLFMWKNIVDKKFLLQHFLFLPFNLLGALLLGRRQFIISFFKALRQIKEVFPERKKEKQCSKLTDREVLRAISRNSEKSSILFIANSGDITGGGQISLLNLLKNMDRNKFMPFVVCPSQGTMVDMLRNIGVEVAIIKIKSLKKLHFISFISSMIKLFKLIKRERIDLIHSNAGATRITTYSLLVARMMRLSFIWHVRVIDSAGLIDRILAPLTSKVIVVSNAAGTRFNWFRRKLDKVITVYNGVDLEEFNVGVKGNEIRKEFALDSGIPLVGIVGRLDPWKGHEYFLEAAAQVMKEIPEAKFLVVGEDIDQNKRQEIKLRNLAEKLRLTNNIIFTGQRNDIPEIMSSLDIFVLSSLKEHFGRVIIEAMGCGKPVIATNAGGVPEIVKDGYTGILVPPRNSDALARAIIDLSKDKKKVELMGDRGRKTAEELFSIEANVKKIEHIYESLLKNGK
jgi:glycosyltransferase involved in cell wall biosynthesis/GT2 family glycosyltransferase